MNSDNAPKLNSPARIGKTTFLVVQWGGVVLSVLFFIFRILVRLSVFRRLHADDGLVLFACIVLLVNTILWQAGAAEALYQTVAVSAGQLWPPPANFAHRTEGYLRKSVAEIALFYTGLWSIKLSFLLFFKRLGQGVRHQQKLWWTVLGFTAASYVVCVGTIQYRCLVSSFLYIQKNCALTPGPVRFQRLTLRANTILDVVTDAMIILVPVNLLWKVQLSVRKKLALGCIFSITVVIMVFAVIRVVVISSWSYQPDQTWVYMWSSIEQSVSIIVACVASFPALFKRSEPDKRRRPFQGHQEGPSAFSSQKMFPFSNKNKAAKAASHDIVTESASQDDEPPVIYRNIVTTISQDHYPKLPADSIGRIVPEYRVQVSV